MEIFSEDSETTRLYEQLIEEIKKRECLWNGRAKNHRCRTDTLKAWKEISRKLNISEFAAKTKWKMLRTIFQRHLKQYMPSSPDEYQGKWKYFRALWFLANASPLVNGKRKNWGAFKLQFPKSDEDSKSSDLNNVESDDIHILDEDICIDNDNRVSFIHETDICNDQITISGTISNNMSEIEETPGLINGMGSDELFLKSLTPFMKRLDPIRNLVVRQRFHDILKTELANAENKSKQDSLADVDI